MAKYRKKPVVIEAVRTSKVMYAAAKRWQDLPPWISEAYDRGEIIFGSDSVSIKTLEGIMVADPTSWILKGVKGELYPCADDIFQATYELVE